MKRYIIEKSPEILELYDRVVSASINYFLDKIEKENSIEIYYDKSDECKVLWICFKYALGFSKSQLKDKTILINTSYLNYLYIKYKKLKDYRKTYGIKIKRINKLIKSIIYNNIDKSIKENISVYDLYPEIYKAYYDPKILLKIEEKEN